MRNCVTSVSSLPLLFIRFYYFKYSSCSILFFSFVSNLIDRFTRLIVLWWIFSVLEISREIYYFVNSIYRKYFSGVLLVYFINGSQSPVHLLLCAKFYLHLSQKIITGWWLNPIVAIFIIKGAQKVLYNSN